MRNLLPSIPLGTIASWVPVCAYLFISASAVYAETASPPKLPASETISRYKLTNPSNFTQAVGHAAELEASAKALQKQGELQMATPDLHSDLTGRTSSSEHVRQKGKANIEKAQMQLDEAALIRSDTIKVREFYLSIAGSSDSAEHLTIVGKAGQQMEVQIVGLYDKNIVIRRKSNGEFAGFGFQHLQSASSDRVVALLRDMKYRQIGSSLRVATSVQPNEMKSTVELLAETEKELVIRDKSGQIKLLERQAADKSFAVEMERNLKSLDEKIVSLGRQVKESVKQEEADLEKVYAKTGQPQSFVVERILSFQKFPLQEHGKYIYQVSIGGNPTILVTRQTQYLTAGNGTLLLKPVGNYDVTMMNESERTVPALVEVDQSLIDRANEIISKIDKIKSESQIKIDSAKKEAGEIRGSLAILNDNKAALARVNLDLLEARRQN